MTRQERINLIAEECHLARDTAEEVDCSIENGWIDHACDAAADTARAGIAALATAQAEQAEAALARAQAERDSLLAAVDVAIADREYFHAEEQRVVAALQRVATVIGEIVIPSPLAHRYYVDNVIYVHDRSTITGAEIKARVPDYGPGWSLYRHGKGNDPDVLVQDTDVMVLSGERLMLAALPPAIGGGSSDAQPPALPPLPEGWTRDDERYVTHVVFERIGRDEEVLVDGDGADVSAVSVDLADLITVLRHAEAAHQRMRQAGVERRWRSPA